ncbi:SseB family protein [Streptomyces sp. NBC_01537]|uniref:SseB family protein n=1 Tax=Streptomyces sp. NBC_01537 TaxID=2903896 RepID=UPI00386DF08C
MTQYNSEPNGALPPAQRALHQIAVGGESAAALSTLAVSDVLLPVPGEPDASGVGPEPQSIQLPVYEQEDGTKLVPVFTDEVRLTEALPTTQRYRIVPLAVLSSSWPSDELTLSIDAGSPDTLTIGGEGVRALAGLSSQ